MGGHLAALLTLPWSPALAYSQQQQEVKGQVAQAQQLIKDARKHQLFLMKLVKCFSAMCGAAPWPQM
jgi:hypothetical protein